jgi:hypothetical protein
MEVTLEPTSKIVSLQVDVTGVTHSMPARIWEGVTDQGTPVHAYVTRICPSVREPLPEHIAKEFEASLKETRAPTPGIAAIPLRLIL